MTRIECPSEAWDRYYDSQEQADDDEVEQLRIDLDIALENQRKLSREKGAALRERDEAREMLKDLEASIRACIERMKVV